jgi:hypothetical protein
MVRCVRLHGRSCGGSRDLAPDLQSMVCESQAPTVVLVVDDGVVQGLTSGARRRVSWPWWPRRLVAGAAGCGGMATAGEEARAAAPG